MEALRPQATCRNVTLLGRALPGEPALPTRSRALFETLLGATHVSGPESGVAALQIQGPLGARHLTHECKGVRRGDLARKLTNELDCGARFSRPYGGTYLVQAQVRQTAWETPGEPESRPLRFLSAEARGARGVQRRFGDRLVSTMEPVDFSVTCDGHLEAVRFHGVRFAHQDLALLLERLFHVSTPADADPSALAGLFELFVTRGMWAESLRLAYHLVLAPRPPDLGALSHQLAPFERTRQARQLLQAYPAPTQAELERWSASLEGLSSELARRGQDLGSPSSVSWLAERITAFCNGELLPRADHETARRFAHLAVTSYLDNDLFAATRKLAPLLEGTFACVVTSTLEPGVAVALCHGKPLSIGVHEPEGTVAIVSDAAMLGIQAEDRPAFDIHLDLDLHRGEVARVGLSYRGVHLSLFDLMESRAITREELDDSGRLIAICEDWPVTKRARPLPFVSPA